MKSIKAIVPAIFLIASILACASPVGTQQVNQAATIAAQTLQALTPASPSTSSLLPHPLYFLNNDKTRLLQIYRLDKDGKTLQQITFEPLAVGNYDVSPLDGSVAYVSNNQLIWVDVNGAGRRVLVDGGTLNNQNRITNTVSSPVWSPDGKTLAFGYNGLNFYTVDSGAIKNVLINEAESTGIPRAIYSPNRYSPDGSKLLINVSYMELGTMGIYIPAANSLAKLTRPDGGIFCCNIAWMPDGSGIYGANATTGMVKSGLMYANASNATVNDLLPGTGPDGNYNYVDAPIIGPDGKLYFFFNNTKDNFNAHTPLYMVRSNTDGVTDRTQLRADAFQNVNEILWSPDASFAILAYAPTQDVMDGGQATIEYVDGRPAVTLASFVLNMKWGK